MVFRKLLSLSAVLLMCASIEAQPLAFDWVRQSSYVDITAITTDNSGNLYTTGIFIGSVDFDPGTGLDTFSDAGDGDIFISKMAPNGHLLWVKHFGGFSYDQGNGLVTDGAGNVYVAGFFSGTVDFDPGPGVAALSCITENSFVLKLDPSGNLVWVKQICGFSENYANTIALGNHNELIITGRFNSTADFDPGSGTDSLNPSLGDLYILKLDTAGNFTWAKQIVSTTVGSGIYSCIADQSGNILAAGNLTGTTDLDPGPGVFNLTATSTTSSSNFLLKLDANGNFLWAYKFDNVDPTLKNGSVLADAANNYYLGGVILGSANLDLTGGSHHVAATTGNDHFILKIDSNANFIWAQQLPDVKSIALDALGSVYTCGSSIQKFLSDGTAQWASDSSLSTRITISSSFDVYTTGAFGGTVDFDPGPGVYALTATDDVFYHKMGQSSLSVRGSLCPANAPFTVYPNPNNGTFAVSCNREDEYFITNCLGQTVRHITALPGAGSVIVEGLPEGTYIIAGRNHNSVKVIVMR